MIKLIRVLGLFSFGNVWELFKLSYFVSGVLTRWLSEEWWKSLLDSTTVLSKKSKKTEKSEKKKFGLKTDFNNNFKKIAQIYEISVPYTLTTGGALKKKWPVLPYVDKHEARTWTTAGGSCRASGSKSLAPSCGWSPRREPVRPGRPTSTRESNSWSWPHDNIPGKGRPKGFIARSSWLFV